MKKVSEIVGEFLVKNGFFLNFDGRLIKNKCIVSIEKDYYKITYYDENCKEWLESFSPDLSIHYLAGYLSWNGIIERGYNK
jgi:hypothetical protein